MRALTSASNLFRRKLCPGSENAEARVIDDPVSPPADEGTLLHPFAANAGLNGLKRDHLTEAQQRLLTIADKITCEFLAATCQEFDIRGEQPALWRYQRLPLIGPKGEELLTGEADIAYLWADSDAAAVIDFKLGFVDVTRAEENYQLAAYGLMWMDFLNVRRVMVAINQPRMPEKKRLTMAVYRRDKAGPMRETIAAILMAARDPNAPRIAGEEQCRFCKSKLFCDEYKTRFQKELATRPDLQTIESIPQEQLHRLGIACKTAGQIKEQVFEEIRRRIEAGEMAGWELKATGQTREISDAVAAYRVFSDYFDGNPEFSGKSFTDCTRIQWGKLSALVKELTGFTEGRSNQLINELLNNLIVRKEKAPSPVPIIK